MRSSVSYILSSSTAEPNMSHPDYEQYSHDHAALLVLVRHIGSQLKTKSFNKYYDRINKLGSVKIQDSTGQVRNILVRYVREHPVENNDWGDFQTHRRLLGLISIGKYDSQQELNEICRVHESLKVKYTSTLYDSRCILIRPSTDLDSPLEASDETSSTTTSGADSYRSEGASKDISPDDSTTILNTVLVPTPPVTQEAPPPIDDSIPHEHKVAQLLDKLRTTESGSSSSPAPSQASPDHKYTTPTNFKTRAFFYSETDPSPDLEQVLSEYVSSLFWVLDGKRLERSREKLDRVSLLFAPFEKKDFVGLDMESRNNKKRCTGRITKNLGDLCLQAGLLAESLSYYATAAETLRAVNDWLWLGGAFEGLCAASALCLYPGLRADNTSSAFHRRNASLQSAQTAQTQHLMQLQVRGLEAEVGQGRGGREVPGCLAPEDMSRRYREAIIHYSKYQNAGIIETEASFKAARISVAQNHPLQAASFLQNVVFINLTLSEQEKIHRFETLSHLYTQIGFIRKAAFCQRLAATRYVSPQNPTPNWNQCYSLMLQSFPGHKLTLDPTEMCSANNQMGWPALQIQLLSELVVAAKRMGHSALATRHMTFLLQTMWQHLTPTDQREFSVQLQSLSAQCEGAPVPLVLDNGLVIPPANLSNIPICAAFTVRNLQPHLKPRKIETEKQNSGPFLFTPINFGSLERKSNRPSSKMEFVWVENEPCYVSVSLINPLPYELRVSNIRLLTSGVVFESLPETTVLPPNEATPIILNGTPRENGDLDLLGYSTHTLGVKSNCRLRYMMGGTKFLPLYNVEVIPSLPTMEVHTSSSSLSEAPPILPPHLDACFDGGSVVASAHITLYNGESTQLEVTFTNSSAHVAIEMLDVSMQTMLDAQMQEQMFTWSAEELASQLPLAPGASATLTLHLHSAANFLAPPTAVSLGGYTAHHSTVAGATVGGGGELFLSSGNGGGVGGGGFSSPSNISLGLSSSLPSRVNSPVNVRSSRGGTSTMVAAGGYRRGDEANTSFRSSNSAQSTGSSSNTMASCPLSSGTLGTRSPTCGTQQHMHLVHGQLQVRYSGGAGLHTAAYCRACAISVTVETMPSLQVTNWDVLPAEVCRQFYLVLDILNLTGQEVELHYTDKKHMLVEAHESCRVPIPVDRCPLSKLVCNNGDGNTGNTGAGPPSSGQTSIATGTGTSVISGMDEPHLHRPTSCSSDADRICSEHIADLVTLHWLLTSTDPNPPTRHGRASLGGITLTAAMLDVVRMSPVAWEVSINGDRARPTEPIQCESGDCLQVRVRVRNCLDRPLHGLTMAMAFYQDYQNGVCNYRLETRLAITGPNKIYLATLQPDGMTEHACNVLIFTPGQYKLDLQCCAPEFTPAPSASPTSTPIVAQQHVWRFIPPIEVLVAG